MKNFSPSPIDTLQKESHIKIIQGLLEIQFQTPIVPVSTFPDRS